MFCPRCGAQNADEANYCYHCGQPMPAAAAPTAATPVAGVQQPMPKAKTVQYAGFWRRFLAMIIDGIILSVPTGILSALLVGPTIAALTNISDIEQLVTAIIPMVIGWMWIGLLAGVLQWVYYAAFESSNLQATPGKIALGIIVTDSKGNRISFARSTGRNAGKLVSHLILYIGYMMAGWTEKKQALHDMMADCLVVMK